MMVNIRPNPVIFFLLIAGTFAYSTIIPILNGLSYGYCLFLCQLHSDYNNSYLIYAILAGHHAFTGRIRTLLDARSSAGNGSLDLCRTLRITLLVVAK